MVEHEGSANRIQENQANLKRTGRLPNVLTELEYPLSDLPPHIHFAGCLPRKPVPSDYHYPNWWPEIAGSASKKIVFVTQGTVACDWEDLLVPTLSGLKNRDDLLVVATLGLPNARLDCDIMSRPTQECKIICLTTLYSSMPMFSSQMADMVAVCKSLHQSPIFCFLFARLHRG